MITIIKKGTKEKCTCNECGCLFSYDKEDIKTIDAFSMGCRDVIICPQCGHEIVLAQSK